MCLARLAVHGDPSESFALFSDRSLPKLTSRKVAEFAEILELSWFDETFRETRPDVARLTGHPLVSVSHDGRLASQLMERTV